VAFVSLNPNVIATLTAFVSRMLVLMITIMCNAALCMIVWTFIVGANSRIGNVMDHLLAVS
jgi:hypothetical protein